MIIFKNPGQLQQYTAQQGKNGLKTGFVPTMGALHKGHISLVETAKRENDITVCSIFINPTQFNDPKDFEKYPVTIEKDIYLLENAGCGVLLLPSVEAIYPPGVSHFKKYDLGFLETVLEGKYRPGHFQGVCQVVHRLLEIVQPNKLYLGQKDYQQCMVINKMLELTGLNKSVSIIVCPTQREEDGLAMSSRNMRLTDAEREKAAGISRTLNYIKKNIRPGNILPLVKEAEVMLERWGFKTDYVSVTDAITLEPLTVWDGKQKITVLAAAYINNIRLIDNMVIN